MQSSKGACKPYSHRKPALVSALLGGREQNHLFTTSTGLACNGPATLTIVRKRCIRPRPVQKPRWNPTRYQLCAKTRRRINKETIPGRTPQCRVAKTPWRREDWKALCVSASPAKTLSVLRLLRVYLRLRWGEHQFVMRISRHLFCRQEATTSASMGKGAEACAFGSIGEAVPRGDWMLSTSRSGWGN